MEDINKSRDINYSLRKLLGSIKRRSRSVFGGTYGETGSVLVYALVVFGLCTMILAASGAKESSAQTLNIRTGHRRKALDLARGSVDEMLACLHCGGFDLCQCGCLERDGLAEGCTCKATAEKDGSSILVTGNATVKNTSETVRVWLEPSSGGGDILSEGVIIAGGKCTAAARSSGGSNPPDVTFDGYIHVGNKRESKFQNINVDFERQVKETQDVPSADFITKMVLKKAGVPDLKTSGNWSGTLPEVGPIVVTANTKVEGPLEVWGNGRSVVVPEGMCLYVDGDFTARNTSVEIDGVMVIAGKLDASATSEISSPNHTGIVICLANEVDVKIKGGWGDIALYVIARGCGELEVESIRTPNGSMFLYAEENLSVRFKNQADFVELEPCSFITGGDLNLDFRSSSNDVSISALAADWEFSETFGPGDGSYHIVKWEEGN